MRRKMTTSMAVTMTLIMGLAACSNQESLNQKNAAEIVVAERAKVFTGTDNDAEGDEIEIDEESSECEVSENSNESEESIESKAKRESEVSAEDETHMESEAVATAPLPATSVEDEEETQVVTEEELQELIAIINQKMREDITVRIVDSEAAQEMASQESAPVREAASKDSTAPTQTVPAVSDELALAQEAFRLVNEERAAAGLSSLTWDDALYEGAEIRAQEAAVCWSHTRPDGSSCFTVSDKCHGENLASGYSAASRAVAGWMGSQGHKENILRSEFTIGAMAVYNDNGTLYWCNLFGR